MVPSSLKETPLGTPVSFWTPNLPTKVTFVDVKSKPTDNVYSYTPSFALPDTNILVPSLLKAIPSGEPSWELTLKLRTKFAVETSKALKLNSYTELFSSPTTNILVPLLLKAIPWGELSRELTLLLSMKVTVDNKLKPSCIVYSFISLPWSPNTNILVPSLLKARPLGAVSWALTL